MAVAATIAFATCVQAFDPARLPRGSTHGARVELLPTQPPRVGLVRADELRQTDVYVAGQDGYQTYRIPSVILTPKGTLLAFAEARREAAADAGDIDLVVKRSRDGGTTWSAMQVIGDNGPNTFGNPCPVIDRKTGRIWLLTTQNLGVDREKDIIAGTSRGTRTVWVMHSDDDSATWSTPIEITNDVKRAGWTWYATGPGVGIQTRRGRLVIPANHAEPGLDAAGAPIHRSHIVYSDDNGRTWKLGASSDAGTNESQIVELADGRLMLNMRNHPPKPENVRLVAISRDGGRTLSPATPDRTLIEPPAQASILAFGRGKSLLFANPASTKRERLTVRMSDNEGRTWPVSRIVHDGPSAYSCLVVLRDGSIGVFYERGDRSPYERITFGHFTRDWLNASN
jgi:sialidase-1